MTYQNDRMHARMNSTTKRTPVLKKYLDEMVKILVTEYQ